MRNVSAVTFVTSLLLAAASGACQEPQDSGTRDPVSLVRDDAVAPPPAPVVREEVIEPRGSGAFDAASYAAIEGVFRVMGVELGDGTTPRTVLLADTRSWATRVYREGDLVGRSYRVAAIHARAVALQPARGEPIQLRPGQDARLRIVEHRLDVVARPLGKHHFSLNPRAASAVREQNATLPSVDTFEMFGGPVLRLGDVQDGTLFDRAGFQRGDLVAAVDGAGVREDSLDAIVRGLTRADGDLTVRFYRQGVPFDRVFTRRGR